MSEEYYKKNTLKWRLEGPFDSSYSLALLNRETALAMKSLGIDVSLHSTEGYGDFDPNPTFLKKNTELAHLYQNSKKSSPKEVDVSSRNLYPPRVCDMYSPINMLHHYAWEESGFPQEWVEDFNHCLSGMTTLSNHVEKIMIDNGVKIPLSVSGCGVDHWEKIIPKINYCIKAKKFRFLHVSSCFPRKGADILLKAYGDVFTAKDDVTLIIKTFPNPHNEIYNWFNEVKSQYDNYPDVLIIEDELSNTELKALYEKCQVLVSPSRAEGFGLPMAEAILSKLAVITTGWGGQLDFCNEKTAWLIDYTFTLAKTHFELFDSVWAEPSQKHLSKLMRDLYLMSPIQRIQKSEYGRNKLLQNFKWTDVASRLIQAEKTFKQNLQKDEDLHIGWVTSWHTKCGIAAYSEHLINAIPSKVTILAEHTPTMVVPDESHVHRCWYSDGKDTLQQLTATIDSLQLNTIVLQFNYGFFNFHHLYEFLYQQIERDNLVIFMMHATMGPSHIPFKDLQIILPVLEHIDRILVHSISDLNYLKKYGLVKNVALFPHGILEWKGSIRKKNTKTFILGSYGFFLPHKGLLELIDAVKIIHDKGINIQLKMINAMYPIAVSKELVQKASKKIKALGLSSIIEMITDFLPDKTSLTQLSECDLLLFPYQETTESSSASVRYGLATKVPVAVTPLKIFSDVKSAVYTLSGYAPEEMAESIISILSGIQNNSDIAQQMQHNASAWIESHSYRILGKRIDNMMTSLHQIKYTK